MGILDWYTLSVAAFSTVVLVAHGATYLMVKTTGPVHNRSALWGRRLWLAALALFPFVSFATYTVRPDLYHSLLLRPAAWLAALVVVTGAVVIWSGSRRHAAQRAFAGSCAVIAGLLAGAAVSVFPVVLRSTLAPEYSLTIYDGPAAGAGLLVGLIWWPVAFALALTYFFIMLRWFNGDVPAQGGPIGSS